MGRKMLTTTSLSAHSLRRLFDPMRAISVKSLAEGIMKREFFARCQKNLPAALRIPHRECVPIGIAVTLV